METRIEMRKKLVDVSVLNVDGDKCSIKYTVDYGNYFRRISDVYDMVSGTFSKGNTLIDEFEFGAMLSRALEQYMEKGLVDVHYTAA